MIRVPIVREMSYIPTEADIIGHIELNEEFAKQLTQDVINKQGYKVDVCVTVLEGIKPGTQIHRLEHIALAKIPPLPDGVVVIPRPQVGRPSVPPPNYKNIDTIPDNDQPSSRRPGDNPAGPDDYDPKFFNPG